MRKHSVLIFAIISMLLGAAIGITFLEADHQRIIKLEQVCHGQCVKNGDAACKDRCAKAHHCPEVDY
jgi:hypothetical protein